MRTVLITGASGRLGRHVVRRFVEGHVPVRALSRRDRTDTAGVTWFRGDLRTGAGLTATFDGVDVVVHCATGRGDLQAARNLIGAAGRAHVVYVSIVGIDEIDFFYYRAKLAVERELERSGLPVTILRATQFHDLVDGIYRALSRLPVALAPAGVRLQPVDADDVAARLVRLALGEPAGRVPDFGGPQVLDSLTLARLYRRRVCAVPVPFQPFTGWRTGHNLTAGPGGTRTFAEFLRSR